MHLARVGAKRVCVCVGGGGGGGGGGRRGEGESRIQFHKKCLPQTPLLIHFQFLFFQIYKRTGVSGCLTPSTNLFIGNMVLVRNVQ